MKKCLIAVVFMLGCLTGVFAKDETKVDELTKYQQQLQALVNQRQQYAQALNQLDVEIIKINAIVQYITEQRKEVKK